MLLSKLNWSVMFAIAGSCGVGVGVMTLLLRDRRNEAMSKASFLKSAMKIANEQPQVVELFGGPLEFGRIDLHDGWSKVKPDLVQLRVPVKGENDNGNLLAYARMNTALNRFRLFKLEATFDKVKDKKLVLLDLAPGEEYEDTQEQVVEQKPILSEKDKKRIELQNEMSKKTIDYQKRYLEQAKDKKSAT